jgi:NitT/TauT family transport system permease protein
VCGLLAPLPKQRKEMSETNISTDGTSQFIAHKKKKRLRLLSTLSAKQTMTYGLIGAVLFFGLWEVAHLMTAEEAKRFLPSPFSVVQALITLIQEKNFMADVSISAYRIFGSFFIASLIAIPLGLLMGCFAPIRALLNPVISGARYLPAASFIPLLLVWFGPTDSQKMALLILGVVFFLIALILDNTEAVAKELIEAAQTMGASRREIVINVVGRAASPAILDSMRNMIAVAYTYLVIAEIVAAQDGIGAVMMRAGRFLKVDVIMAGILAIGIMGVLTDIAFRLAAHYAFPWNRKRSG